MRETLAHPKCKGITFWPTSEGGFMVSLAWITTSSMIVMYDHNPMMALYKCMVEFERRIDEKVDA